MSAFSAGEVGSGPIDNGAAADGVARGASSSRWSVSLCPYPLTCMNVGTTKRIAKMIIVIEIARRLCGSTGRRVPNGFAEAASGVGGSDPSIGPFTSTCASIPTSTIVASSSTRTVDDPFAGEDVRLMTTHGPGGGRDGVDRICPRGPARRKIRVPSGPIGASKKESARRAAGLGAELRNRVSNLDQISPHGHALT